MAKFGSVSLGALNATFAVQTDLQRTYPGNASTGATVGFDISGAFVGIITFEFTIDDTNWFPVAAHQTGPSGLPGPVVLTAAAAGRYSVNGGGYSQVRVRMSSYTSGTAVVAAAVPASPSDVLILREQMITNELLAQLLNTGIDVNNDYRSDITFGP